MTFAGDATLNDVVSAVLMFEGGPTSSVVECSLLGRRITLDLFRPTPEFVVVRLDQVDVCDLHTLWGPLEIHTLGEKNHRAHGSQCVVSGIFTDYPRVLASTRSVSRFKLPGVDWSYGDNGDALVDRGVCILSNPQRAVVEIVSHEWAGIIVVRRGPLLNAADLYSSQRRRGLIIGESCDIVIGRNTGLGPGESPLFGAFADIFNP